MQERAVGDLMSRDPMTVPPDASFKDVVRALSERDVHAAPVVDADGTLLGIVSASDLTCHEEEPAAWSRMLGRQAREHLRKARGRTARDLMTSPARTVPPDATCCRALREMSDAHIGQLVVMDGGRVAGMLTRRDVLRAFLRDDDEIRREVEQAVTRAVGDCPAQVQVDVHDGVVRLSGHVERLSCAWAATAGARSVMGVVDVEDDVSFDTDDTDVHELSVRGPFA